MITEERMDVIFIEANPAPDVDALDLVELGSTAYLATLEQRSTEVIELEPRQEETSDNNSAKWWLAAAAVVAVVLGVAWVMLSDGNEGAPAVTIPTPSTAVVPPPTSAEATTTTEVVDPRVDEGLVVATSFVTAYAAFDAEGTAEHGLMDSGSWDLHWGLIHGENEDGAVEEGALEAGAVAFADAIGLVRTVESCEVSGVNAVGMNAICTVLHETSFTESLGVDPVPFEMTFAVRFEGEPFAGNPMESTLVVERQYISGASEFQASAWGPLVAWIEQNHPEDVESMISSWYVQDLWDLGVRPPILSTTSIDLWRQHVAEFNAVQGQ